jgi:dTDP-4-dehydrorhamnose 3,5-epimerase
MNVSSRGLGGQVIIEPRLYRDERGFFLETWNDRRYREHGLSVAFVQDNLSSSRAGVLRGLHYQNPMAQGKLVSVIAGEVFDVAVDIRQGSLTFKKWWGITLSGDNKRQIYIPPGFAHGFVVLSEVALFHYKCTDYYSPKDEITIRWDDPELAIQWPIPNPVVSERDCQGLFLRDIPKQRLFD